MIGSRVRSTLARRFVFLLPLALGGCGTPDALNPATSNGNRVFNLFVISMIVSAVVFLLVVGLLACIIIRFRSGARQDEPDQVSGNRSLEFGWTAAPAIILTVIFILTMRTMLAVDDPPPDGGVAEPADQFQTWLAQQEQPCLEPAAGREGDEDWQQASRLPAPPLPAGGVPSGLRAGGVGSSACERNRRHRRGSRSDRSRTRRHPPADADDLASDGGTGGSGAGIRVRDKLVVRGAGTGRAGAGGGRMDRRSAA